MWLCNILFFIHELVCGDLYITDLLIWSFIIIGTVFLLQFWKLVLFEFCIVQLCAFRKRD